MHPIAGPAVARHVWQATSRTVRGVPYSSGRFSRPRSFSPWVRFTHRSFRADEESVRFTHPSGIDSLYNIGVVRGGGGTATRPPPPGNGGVRVPPVPTSSFPAFGSLRSGSVPRVQELAGVGALDPAGGGVPGLYRLSLPLAGGAGLAADRERALDRVGDRVRDPRGALDA